MKGKENKCDRKKLRTCFFLLFQNFHVDKYIFMACDAKLAASL